MRRYIRKIVRNDYLMLAMGLVICIDSFGEVWHVLVEFSHDNVVWFNPDRQYLFTRTYEISDFFFGDNIDADEASVFVIFNEIVIGFTAADQAIIQALDSEMRIRIQQGDSVFVEGAVEVDQKRCIFTRRRSLG